MDESTFKQQVEYAKTLKPYDVAYNYLFSHNIYVTKDIWHYSSEELYEWLRRQEDGFKTMDFQPDNLEEWYRKMKYLMVTEQQVPAHKVVKNE